ncbi:uncharacterized protein BP5553_10305 [Venustampulla echinocandica]|uniref:Uncharacterized protein n=1 Tax=Venustampulla echinocandica TaxID=2656787 RepID=A0A370T9T2_9HELO|nr:uncharacterized protein BP5553_10305 [Venustampulla echinocandica]RDL30427.1 hypothetical protein BP5553_10305 [Venustampulla echinocandica]
MRVNWKPKWLKRPLFRKSVLEEGHSSDAMRDQIARHATGSGVFNGSYINKHVNFNSQDAYLESEVSEEGLTRVFAYMSLRYNPGAPSGVPSELLHELLTEDTKIATLGREVEELRKDIKATYSLIKHALAERIQEYRYLQQRLKNAKKSLIDEFNTVYRQDYFSCVYNEMMKMSLDQTAIVEPGDEPMVQHALEERNQL